MDCFYELVCTGGAVDLTKEGVFIQYTHYLYEYDTIGFCKGIEDAKAIAKRMIADLLRSGYSFMPDKLDLINSVEYEDYIEETYRYLDRHNKPMRLGVRYQFSIFKRYFLEP